MNYLNNSYQPSPSFRTPADQFERTRYDSSIAFIEDTQKIINTHSKRMHLSLLFISIHLSLFFRLLTFKQGHKIQEGKIRDIKKANNNNKNEQDS